jgi:hypothetical protein
LEEKSRKWRRVQETWLKSMIFSKEKQPTYYHRDNAYYRFNFMAVL